MNILPLVMQYFGPVIMNKIAGSLGINSTIAQKAIAAAAPAILAGLINKATQPGGAKVLFDILAKQDPGMLGKLGEMIGTGKQAGVVEQGSAALGSLLGSGTLSGLAGAVSKYAGIGAGASNTLLGLMAPAVLGTLGREQKAESLDAAGLANMLAGQKQQIANALPADFSKLLSGLGLLDAVQGKVENGATMKPAGQSTTSPAKPAAPAAKTAAPGATAGAGLHHHHFSWGPWVVAIAAASALWWGVFGDKVMQDQPTVAIPASLPPSTTLATAPGLPDVVARTDVGKQIVALIDDTRGALSAVRDAATAQSALPKLQDVSGRFEKIAAQAAALNPEARRALATFVTSQSGLIKSAVGAVLALPGLPPALKPALEQLVARVDTLAKG